jgi:ATP-binding cassette subfamily B multidrug efflux pump
MNPFGIPLIRNILLSRLPFRLLILLASVLAAGLGLGASYFQKSFIDEIVLRNFSESVWVYQALGFAFLCFLVASFLSQLTLYLGYREALISQRKISETLYRHALRLKSESLEKRTVGETVALYATDIPASTVLLEQTLPYGASTFFPILLSPIALHYMIGTSLIEVYALVFFVAALNTALAFKQSGFFYTFKQLAAERVSKVNEWLQSIRSLKILNWIEPFEDRILDVREKETINRIKMVTNGQMMNAITSHATFIFNIAAGFLLITVQKRELTAGEIWAIFWVLGLFLNRPLRQLPWFFTFGFDAVTSSKRLQNFLDLKPFHNYDVKTAGLSSKDNLLEVKGLSWGNQTSQVLDQLDFEIKKGEKVAILGEVGAGKTAFLLCLLGELHGKFEQFFFQGQSVDGLQAKKLKTILNYVPQESFLMNSNLRDNVSFEYRSTDFDDGEIISYLSQVDFVPEQEGLTSGLETSIGERGVNLSGGQRQRLSLARSMAQGKELILMDDSMSQLDSVTESKILKDLFKTTLKGKSVIVTTHRLSILQYVDTIYELKNGKLVKIEKGAFL